MQGNSTLTAGFNLGRSVRIVCALNVGSVYYNVMVVMMGFRLESEAV